MDRRKLVVRAVLVIIGLPVVLLLAAAASFYVAFYSMDRANGTIVSSGQQREYLLYVPRSYDRTKPTPLVISMHAAMLWPAHQVAANIQVEPTRPAAGVIMSTRRAAHLNRSAD